MLDEDSDSFPLKSRQPSEVTVSGILTHKLARAQGGIAYPPNWGKVGVYFCNLGSLLRFNYKSGVLTRVAGMA